MRETILFHDEDLIEDEEIYYDTEEDMFAEDLKVEDPPKLESSENYEDVMMPFSTGSTPPGTPPEYYIGSLPTEFEVNTILSILKKIEYLLYTNNLIYSNILTSVTLLNFRIQPMNIGSVRKPHFQPLLYLRISIQNLIR